MAKEDWSERCCEAAHGMSNGINIIACMDFSFIGGSMGAVVGENLSSHRLFLPNQYPYTYHIQIGWSKDVGSWNFFDAIGKIS